ncbi:MAG: hypothetical protein ACP5IC_00460 [Minisyncoccia bacterium]
MSNYGFFILLLIIIGLAIYIYFQPQTVEKVIKIPSTSTSVSSSVAIQIQKNNIKPKPINNSNNVNNSNNLTQNNTTITNPVTPPPGFTINNLSPYYQKIRINNVYINYNYYSNNQIVLYSKNITNPIDITGWHIKSNKGDIIIPPAVSDLNPSNINTPSDIYLPSNNYVYIFNNYSPTSYNFRLNKCTGYLNNTYKFNPPLPCDYPQLFNRYDISSFSGQCQNFIFSLSRCTGPSIEQLNYWAKEPNCRSFLDRFNYNGCYNLLKSSSDFFENKWYLWINGIWGIDQYHDKILLFDKNNLLVDEYIY